MRKDRRARTGRTTKPRTRARNTRTVRGAHSKAMTRSRARSKPSAQAGSSRRKASTSTLPKAQKRRSSRVEPKAARTRPRTTRAAQPPEEHLPSPTAIAAEALELGVIPVALKPEEEPIPHESEKIVGGDIDNDPLEAAFVGDEAPGGSAPTPDQDRVDDIGRALGVQDVDNGALRTTAELLDKRDRRRTRLEGFPRKTR